MAPTPCSCLWAAPRWAAGAPPLLQAACKPRAQSRHTLLCAARGGREPGCLPAGQPTSAAGLPASPPSRPQLSWCATEDIGRVAAAIIAGGPERWGDKAAGVAGEHASLQEVADAFARMFRKQVGGAAGRRRLAWHRLASTAGACTCTAACMQYLRRRRCPSLNACVSPSSPLPRRRWRPPRRRWTTGSRRCRALGCRKPWPKTWATCEARLARLALAGGAACVQLHRSLARCCSCSQQPPTAARVFFSCPFFSGSSSTPSRTCARCGRWSRPGTYTRGCRCGLPWLGGGSPCFRLHGSAAERDAGCSPGCPAPNCVGCPALRCTAGAGGVAGGAPRPAGAALRVRPAAQELHNTPGRTWPHTMSAERTCLFLLLAVSTVGPLPRYHSLGSSHRLLPAPCVPPLCSSARLGPAATICPFCLHMNHTLAHILK